MEYKAINAFYFNSLNEIGGVESFFEYVAKKYHKYDITVFYVRSAPQKIKTLSQYVRMVKIQNTDTIECEVMFVNYNREILDRTKAKKVYMFIHSDYKALIQMGMFSKEVIPNDPRIDGYLGVSQLVCDSWEEVMGIKAEAVYEPVEIDKSDPLMFITASRLSREKGYERMVELSKRMDEEGLNYLWFVFTNTAKFFNSPNVIMCKPKQNISEYMKGFDALIQLSSNEGYCLSAIEALKQGIPVIKTPCPVFDELGLNDENSVTVPFDMKDIDMDRIRNIKKLKFKYHEPEDRIKEYLVKTKARKRNRIRVRATGEYQKRHLVDVGLGRVPELNEEWEIDLNRLNAIQEWESRNGVKLIEEQG